MSDAGDGRRLRDEVGKKERRKLRARHRGKQELWFGLGMFGLVGWSVAIPTLLGIALGVAIDRAKPGQISWTLTFLFVGIVLGCVNAWYWVNRLRSDDER